MTIICYLSTHSSISCRNKSVPCLLGNHKSQYNSVSAKCVSSTTYLCVVLSLSGHKRSRTPPNFYSFSFALSSVNRCQLSMTMRWLYTACARMCVYVHMMCYTSTWYHIYYVFTLYSTWPWLRYLCNMSGHSSSLHLNYFIFFFILRFTATTMIVTVGCHVIPVVAKM